MIGCTVLVSPPTLVWHTEPQQALINWVTDGFSVQQEEKRRIIEAIHNTKLTEDELRSQQVFIEWVEEQVVKGTVTETEHGEAVKRKRFTPKEAKDVIAMILEDGYFPGHAYLRNAQNISDLFVDLLHDCNNASDKASRRANALAGRLVEHFNIAQPISGQGMCGMMIT